MELETVRRNIKTSIDESNGQISALRPQGEQLTTIIPEVASLRQELNELLETRSSMAQEMDLPFDRTASRLTALENSHLIVAMTHDDPQDPLGQPKPDSTRKGRSRNPRDKRS